MSEYENSINLRRYSTIGRVSIDVRNLDNIEQGPNPIELATSRVQTLLQQAQDEFADNPKLASILDKISENLKTIDISARALKETVLNKKSKNEPVATDLIEALLSSTVHSTQVTTRKESMDSSISSSNKNFKYNMRIKMPQQLINLLESGTNWNFDIIYLEELSNKHPLLYLGMHLFLKFEVPSTLNIEEKILYNWLVVLEANYRNNSYHNSTHAADVMQAIASFATTARLRSIFSHVDVVAALIAGAAHDLDHPGKSSAFLANSKDELAILYNDISILESHHSALMFKLTLGDDRLNIFKNLETDDYKIIRANIIDMILATEMTKHFDHLSKFVSFFCQGDDGTEITTITTDSVIENLVLIKRIMIKSADVSNPTRPLALCVEWAMRITEEYFAQTDEEKARGLPVVMPNFDRQTCSVPKSQIGFVDFIVQDMFEAWNAFVDMPEMLTNMTQNYLKWKEFEKEGYSTLADVRKLQVTVIHYPSEIRQRLIEKSNFAV